MPIINPLPYTIANGNPVDATPVEANLAQIVSNVNANAALVGGNASQEFLVATTANPAGAVPLAQANGAYAPIAGNASQQFLVATTTNPSGAIPLAQAQGAFAPISGSAANVFNVANAVASTEAVPLGQAQAQFAPVNGSAANVFNVATASAGTAAVPLAQTIGAGASGYVDQTANRAFGVGYNNTTGRPLWVTTLFNSYANSTIYGSVNGITVAQITDTSSSGSSPSTLTLLVPPNASYAIGPAANAGLVKWYEY